MLAVGCVDWKREERWEEKRGEEIGEKKGERGKK